MNLIGYGAGSAADASRRHNKCVATLGAVYRLVRKWKVVGVKVNLNGLSVRTKLPPPQGEPRRSCCSSVQNRGSVCNLVNLGFYRRLDTRFGSANGSLLIDKPSLQFGSMGKYSNSNSW